MHFTAPGTASIATAVAENGGVLPSGPRFRVRPLYSGSKPGSPGLFPQPRRRKAAPPASGVRHVPSLHTRLRPVEAAPYLPGPGDCLPGALSIGLYEHPAGWVVLLVGELDIATAGVLTGRLDQPGGAARPHVVADLSGLGFCDWSGLAALLGIHERAVGHGGWLRLCAPAAGMRKLLRITGQSKVLRCYPGIDEAFAEPSAATRETDAARAVGTGPVGSLVVPPRLRQNRGRNAGYAYDPEM